jgi:glycosyltransferase involved in cell wall biosynthesis
MATFNGERFIGRQLESLSRQTCLPTELVVQDDGSQDGTVEIVNAFARSAPFPVHVFVNATRLGYADNFLSACDRASGDLIAFCDQDDFWFPTKLERCSAELSRTGSALAVHQSVFIDETDQEIGLNREGIRESRVYYPFELHPWGFFSGFAEMFDAKLLKYIPPNKRPIDNVSFEGQLAHDRWVYMIANSLMKTVAIAEPLAYYRLHGKNASREFRPEGNLNSRKRVPNSVYYRKHADIARFNSRMFRDVASGGHKAAEKAAEHWNAIADHCERRARLYEGERRLQRLGRLGALAYRGAYLPYRLHGLGPRAFVRDVAEGILGLTVR